MIKNEKIFWAVLFFVFCFSPFSFLLALDTSESETIKEFFVEIRINRDNNLIVKEKIIYDFGSNLRHGIYREIPLQGIKIKLLGVVDENSNPYPFEINKPPGSFIIKIGDPDKLISGAHTYIINYEVRGALGFYDYYDELYWNVTGNGWSLPIEKAGARIIFPEPVSPEKITARCFTGAYGSVESKCQINTIQGEVSFSTLDSLPPKHGLTIKVAWPKGIVKGLSFWQKFLRKAKEIFLKIGPFLIPCTIFVFLFLKWKKTGKDEPLGKPIVVQYEPPDNLRPAEVKMLLKESVNTEDISATIIDLAVRGYLKIQEIEKEGLLGGKKKDYRLIKTDQDTENLKEYEVLILKKLFQDKKEVFLSNLKGTLPFLKGKVYKKIGESLQKNQYFFVDPHKVRTKYFFWGMIIALTIAPLFSSLFGLISFAIAIFVAGLLFFIFGFFMPKKTKKGRNAYWHALGFKEYIEKAEKYRAQFYEKVNIFEKYLPYAIALGLTDKWSQAFKEIYAKPPSWYDSSTEIGFFNPSLFVSQFNRTIKDLSRGSTSSSGFSGGYSGGGRGGGGGRSW